MPIPQGRYALFSLSNKKGMCEIAQDLSWVHGIGILATGKTGSELRGAGVEVIDVAEYTGFPEMMGGRVKTLHPFVHGGMLGRPEDAEVMTAHGIVDIDFVVVNLYPFEDTIAKPDCTPKMAIEQIDIGGPAMLRSAAKNHARTTVLCDPVDYGLIIAEMSQTGGTVLDETRFMLARKAFAHTAKYDAAIEAYLGTFSSESPQLRIAL